MIMSPGSFAIVSPCFVSVSEQQCHRAHKLLRLIYQWQTWYSLSRLHLYSLVLGQICSKPNRWIQGDLVDEESFCATHANFSVHICTGISQKTDVLLYGTVAIAGVLYDKASYLVFFGRSSVLRCPFIACTWHSFYQTGAVIRFSVSPPLSCSHRPSLLLPTDGCCCCSSPPPLLFVCFLLMQIKIRENPGSLERWRKKAAPWDMAPASAYVPGKSLVFSAVLMSIPPLPPLPGMSMAAM